MFGNVAGVIAARPALPPQSRQNQTFCTCLGEARPQGSNFVAVRKGWEALSNIYRHPGDGLPGQAQE
jgi:hypothetical protein